MPDEICRGCNDPLLKGDTASYCNSDGCDMNGPYCDPCFDDHKSAHRMAEPVPKPLAPAEIVERCPRCGSAGERCTKHIDYACGSADSPNGSFVQSVLCRDRGAYFSRIIELERTLASRDAEIARLKRPRDFVSECNSLLAAKDAEIDRLRAELAGKE